MGEAEDEGNATRRNEAESFYKQSGGLRRGTFRYSFTGDFHIIAPPGSRGG